MSSSDGAWAGEGPTKALCRDETTVWEQSDTTCVRPRSRCGKSASPLFRRRESPSSHPPLTWFTLGLGGPTHLLQCTNHIDC